MPPVGGAVAALGTLFGGGGFSLFGSTLIGGLAKLAAGAGLSYVANALAGKPEEGAIRKNRPSGMEVSLRAGDIVPRFFIVGTWATAGQLVYVRSWGEGNKTPNAFLTQVIVLSHMPVSELTKVYVDGAPVTWTPGASQADKGQAISDYRKDSKDHLWIRFHDGSQSAADSLLTSTFPSGTRAWASSAVGRGVAYVVVTSRWNPKLFSHAPELKFQVKGLPLYDITKDSTAGGSGTQRWAGAKPTAAEMATWTFTRNPAVILYNLFRGVFDTWNLDADRQWVYGLQTVSKAQLPFSSWASAINECDVTITNADASTEAQFRAGGELSFATEPGEEIEELLKACNGRLADVGGVYKVKVGAATAAVGSFTDDALMLSDEHSFTPFPSLNDTVNGIAAVYVSPEEGWIEKAAPPRINSDYVTADGGRRSIADVAYRRVSEKRQVQRLTKAALLEERRFRRHVVVLPPEAFAWEPLDYIAWTSTRNGYTAKLFRIDGMIDRDNLDQVVSITEVDPSDYDWTAGSDEIATTDGPIDLERPPAQPILSFTASGTSSTGDDGRATAVIRVNWDAGVDDVDKVKFEVRKGTGSKPMVCRDETTFPETGTYDISKAINGATAYEVRAIFQDVDGRRDFTWSNWIAVTTPNVQIGLAQLAASLQSLIAAGAGDGKTRIEEVLPPARPSAFLKLFRIALYTPASGDPTTAPSSDFVSSGFYLFIDAAGTPGAFLDVANFAVGQLSKAAQKAFPFEVGSDGLVKIRKAAIPLLQAGQIDATSLTVEKFKAGSVTVDAIKGGSITQVVDGRYTGNKIDVLEVSVPTGKIGGRVQIVANLSFDLPRGASCLAVMRRKAPGSATWVTMGGSGFYTSNGTDTGYENLSGQIVAFDEVQTGTVSYQIHRTLGVKLKKTSSIYAVWFKK